MSKRTRGLPSPAIVISILALVFAASGGAFALSKASESKQDKRIAKKVANKQITKRAKKLSVKHAASADTAANADHASSSDTATNADHATSADSATPSGSAGGDLAGSYPNPSLAPRAGESLGLHDSGMVIVPQDSNPTLLTVGPFAFAGSCISGPSGLIANATIATTRNNSTYTVASHAIGAGVAGSESFNAGSPGILTGNSQSTTERETVYQVSAAAPDGTLITGALYAGTTGGASNSCTFRIRVYG